MASLQTPMALRGLRNRWNGDPDEIRRRRSNIYVILLLLSSAILMLLLLLCL